eukprot:PhF_6_TR25738/c0_g1_i1/m.36274
MPPKKVKALPVPYPNGIIPYLCVADPLKAIEFYKKAFNAEAPVVMDGPDNTVIHAEIRAFGHVFMLSSPFPTMGVKAAEDYKGSPIGVCMYVPDVDKAYAQAIKAGGKDDRPPADQFYGDRTGTLIDPFGIRWTLAMNIEVVTGEMMVARMAAMAGGENESNNESANKKPAKRGKKEAEDVSPPGKKKPTNKAK